MKPKEYYNVVKEGVQGIFNGSAAEAKKIAATKSGSEFLGSLMTAPMNGMWNILGQSLKTHVKLTALLGKDLFMAGCNLLGKIPLIALPNPTNPEAAKTQSIAQVMNSTRKKYNQLITA